MGYVFFLNSPISAKSTVAQRECVCARARARARVCVWNNFAQISEEILKIGFRFPYTS
jgi:hypothetical protein